MTEDKKAATTGWRKLLGPGLVAGAADDDPSGVATYSQAGAAFGYGLLWVVMLTTPLMLAVQLVSARIGRVTGAGVVANAREHLPRGVALGLVVLMLVANVANIAADLAAMGEALQLILQGGKRNYGLAIGAAGLLAQVIVPYRQYARFLRWSTLALFAYVAAAFAVEIDWPAALRGAFLPNAVWGRERMMMIVAVLGTTISPYLFVWQAAQEIEEMGVARKRPLRDASMRGELRRLRLDTGAGVVLSNLVAFFIMLTTAGTLNAHGVTDIETAAQAAEALRPLAGDFAFFLFALGIIGTGLLAIPVLAGSAAYAVSDVIGGSFSLEAPFTRAPGFYGIVIFATLLGAALDFTAIQPMQMLLWTALLNGIIAPPFLFAMMIVAGNERAMGAHVSPGWLAALGWIATAAMTLAVLSLAISISGFAV
ncbi:divalent metal cation transporter [Methylocystis sp. MJC1]|uniref:NRAMP family divalent metal transporter n=1 Tax=Methylocystis sp. MJC1 TaxID=2654282 RepID=UPI0013EA0A1A|nr:divalent metal cation transporter [Methylocystis sp. MJC1]KAF2988827.1 Divalent metal cation transporter MntH [Methylocystis sp. MJC1]MBU6528579.1 divalent metal cation transporter [Methylocystis sp. MJC1]UZX11472.1 divalent metal cation transporter [Methylocystis sp. MJC1]